MTTDKYLHNAKLDDFGTAPRVTLASDGPEIAADIDLKIISVSGFDAARYATLVAWRYLLASKFTFDQTAGVNASDFLALDHRMNMLRDQLERRLLQGRGELEHLVRPAEVLRNPPYHALAQATLQLGLERPNYIVVRQ